ncbi:MAG: FAD-dependent oxidoreductase [Candidatus Velthaea sp.]
MPGSTPRYDVIVVGGGAAGVGAAAGAAGAGARVALLERAPFLGGAATLSNVLTYCGFWTQADPPRACVGGVGARVLDEIGRYDGIDGPVRMHASNVVVALLDPEAVKIALDRVCAAAGVDVILHAFVSAADAAGGRITGVTYADHAGATALSAAAFVDASGDADLATRAGASVQYGDAAGNVQNGTLVMRFGGIDSAADVSRGVWSRAIRDGKEHGLSEMTKEYGFVSRIPGSGDVVAFLADEAYDARDARATSAAEQRGRRQAWAYLEAIRLLPGHGRAYLVSTGPAIGTRESRHVVSGYQLTQRDVEDAVVPADTVALGGWPVEYHGGPGKPNVWRRIRGEGAYGIPLRTLRSRSHSNLFAAGRTIDADAYAFASARVMGTAFATGHAAGVAAAAVAGGARGDDAAVRAELLRQDAILALQSTKGPHLA